MQRDLRIHLGAARRKSIVIQSVTRSGVWGVEGAGQRKRGFDTELPPDPVPLFPQGRIRRALSRSHDPNPTHRSPHTRPDQGYELNTATCQLPGRGANQPDRPLPRRVLRQLEPKHHLLSSHTAECGRRVRGSTPRGEGQHSRKRARIVGL